MYLSTFQNYEYLTSTCTWYIFRVLGVLDQLCLTPNPNMAFKFIILSTMPNAGKMVEYWYSDCVLLA